MAAASLRLLYTNMQEMIPVSPGMACVRSARETNGFVGVRGYQRINTDTNGVVGFLVFSNTRY